ncbi:hypothetical protein SK128_002663, partial [Halocaridina rubra]
MEIDKIKEPFPEECQPRIFHIRRMKYRKHITSEVKILWTFQDVNFLADMNLISEFEMSPLSQWRRKTK